MPVRKDGYWYYTRTVEGQQYGIHCRRAVADGETAPPSTRDGSPLPGEQVLLDGNAEAGDSEFFALGTLRREPGRAAARVLGRPAPATSGSRCGARTCAPASCCRTR